MKIQLKTIFLATVILSGPAFNSFAAESGTVNLVKPIVAPLAVEAIKNATVGLACENGLVLQKNGFCCPAGSTNDNKWPSVCTPVGTIDSQIFSDNDVVQYCPSADMFIVSDKNINWTCASSDSTVMYPDAKGSEGGKFCRKHGYGHLIKIKPRGTVGCVKTGDSQGDGCIEAGTCSFEKGR
ncbi:MAG: hypothetical protein H7X83_04590 [Verrucomicrobia bacterium]|nr:hypothetical protein [Deltaproteobacteria bacterium]